MSDIRAKDVSVRKVSGIGDDDAFDEKSAGAARVVPVQSQGQTDDLPHETEDSGATAQPSIPDSQAASAESSEEQRSRKERFLNLIADEMRAWMAEHQLDESRQGALKAELKTQLDEVQEYAHFVKTAATCAFDGTVWKIGQALGVSDGEGFQKYSLNNRELCLRLEDCEREATKEERAKRIRSLWRKYVARARLDVDYHKSTEDFRKRCYTALNSALKAATAV